jgi:peptidyl-tRNA hydrolase
MRSQEAANEVSEYVRDAGRTDVEPNKLRCLTRSEKLAVSYTDKSGQSWAKQL